MECGFPFLFSFKPFKIHSTKNPERPWPPRIGPSSISRSIAINKPRVENGIATRCITREKRQGRDLTRVRAYETDACAHSFRSRRFVDRLRILRPGIKTDRIEERGEIEISGETRRERIAEFQGQRRSSVALRSPRLFCWQLFANVSFDRSFSRTSVFSLFFRGKGYF